MFNRDLLLCGGGKKYSITIAGTKGGSVSVSKTKARKGETIEIYLHPKAYSVVKSVSIPGVTISGTGNTRTFVMPNHDVKISATFRFYAKLTITVGTYYENSHSGIGSDRVDRRVGYFSEDNEGISFGSLSPYSLREAFFTAYEYTHDAGSWYRACFGAHINIDVVREFGLTNATVYAKRLDTDKTLSFAGENYIQEKVFGEACYYFYSSYGDYLFPEAESAKEKTIRIDIYTN